jgi:hypothetical protein
MGIVLLLRAPAERALGLAEARIDHEVADGEGDRQVEQVDPPARQRLVVLGDVAVPDMAGGFTGGQAAVALP